MSASADPLQQLVPAVRVTTDSGEQVPERPVPAEGTSLEAALRYWKRLREKARTANAWRQFDRADRNVRALSNLITARRSREVPGGNGALSGQRRVAE